MKKIPKMKKPSGLSVANKHDMPDGLLEAADRFADIGQKLLNAFIDIMNGQPGYMRITALQGTVALILKGCAKDKSKESLQNIGMQFLLQVCELLEFLSQENEEDGDDNES